LPLLLCQGGVLGLELLVELLEFGGIPGCIGRKRVGKGVEKVRRQLDLGGDGVGWEGLEGEEGEKKNEVGNGRGGARLLTVGPCKSGRKGSEEDTRKVARSREKRR
jgi:hypothetical protein